MQSLVKSITFSFVQLKMIIPAISSSYVDGFTVMVNQRTVNAHSESNGIDISLKDID